MAARVGAHRLIGGVDAACGGRSLKFPCATKSFPGAGRFAISEDVGYTAIIATGQICEAPSCDGFAKIQCNP